MFTKQLADASSFQAFKLVDVPSSAEELAAVGGINLDFVSGAKHQSSDLESESVCQTCMISCVIT